MLDLFDDFLHSFLKFMVSSILAVSIYPDSCTRRKGPCLSSNVLDAFPVVLLSYFCAEKIYLSVILHCSSLDFLIFLTFRFQQLQNVPNFESLLLNQW